MRTYVWLPNVSTKMMVSGIASLSSATSTAEPRLFLALHREHEFMHCSYLSTWLLPQDRPDGAYNSALGSASVADSFCFCFRMALAHPRPDALTVFSVSSFSL